MESTGSSHRLQRCVDRMGDLAHGRARRFAHHGDQVIVLPDAVDVEAALLQEPGRRRRRDERLDEHADRDEAIGKHEMRDALATPAQLAKAFHDLREAGRHARDDPAGILRDDVAGRTFEHLPVGAAPSGHDGSTIARSMRALIVRSLNANCSTPSPRSFSDARLQQQPGRRIRTRIGARSAARPSARTRRPAPARPPTRSLADDAEFVVPRQRLLLLGRAATGTRCGTCPARSASSFASG